MADYGPKKNREGYNDPTAYHGLRAATRSDCEQIRRLSTLINVLKYIIDLAGYDLMNRIELKDRRTGKEYR